MYNMKNDNFFQINYSVFYTKFTSVINEFGLDSNDSILHNFLSTYNNRNLKILRLYYLYVGRYYIGLSCINKITAIINYNSIKM